MVCHNVTSRLLETGWAGFLQSDDKSRLFVHAGASQFCSGKNKSMNNYTEFSNLWGQNLTIKEHCCTLINPINNREIIN